MRIYFFRVTPSGTHLRDILHKIGKMDLEDRELIVSDKPMRLDTITFPSTRQCNLDFVRARGTGLPGRAARGAPVSDLEIEEHERIVAMAAAVLMLDTIAIQRNMAARESTIARYINDWAQRLDMAPVNLIPEITHDTLAALSRRKCRSITMHVHCEERMSEDMLRNHDLARVLHLRNTIGYRKVEITMKAPRGGSLSPSEVQNIASLSQNDDHVEKLTAELSDPDDGGVLPLDLLGGHSSVEFPNSQLPLTRGRQYEFKGRVKAIEQAVGKFLEGE